MDSEWICKLLLAGLLKPNYIPPKEQRQLCDLTRYRNKLIQQIASEKNRMMRVLEDCNIKLSCVVSDTSGVTATSLINMICDGKYENAIELLKEISGFSTKVVEDLGRK